MTGKVQTAAEQTLRFKIGPIELLLLALLGFALWRIWLERRSRRVPVVELEAAPGVADATKAKVEPALQGRLLGLQLAPPAILPSPSATESLGTILTESGVPSATTLGKALTSIASLVWPPAGYISMWTADLPDPTSKGKGSATVIVREAASGSVVGAKSVGGGDSDALLDGAADAIWSIIMRSTPIGKAVPAWRRWLKTDGSSYREFREVSGTGGEAGSNAAAIVQLEELKKGEPFNSDVSLALADRYAKEDDHLAAIAEYRRACTLSPVSIDARYRLAASYSFVKSWLGVEGDDERCQEIRQLEKDVLSGPGRRWEELTAAFLDLAVSEYQKLLLDLGWFRVFSGCLGPDRAAASEWRRLLGLTRFSRRGRIRLLIRSAQVVAQLQQRELARPVATDASWVSRKLYAIAFAAWGVDDWQVDYNVICFLAHTPDHGRTPDEADREVVKRLRRLTLNPRTNLDVDTIRWIACEDPDLKRLRDTPDSGFNRFWSEHGGACPAAQQAPSDAELLGRFTFGATVARRMASIWDERSGIVAGWTWPNGDWLVRWFEHEQRVASSMLSWIEDPNARREALDAAVGSIPDVAQPADKNTRLQLTATWTALHEPADTLHETTRALYEALVTERAGDKPGAVQTAALAGTLRAAARWRALEKWLLKPADADARKEYESALDVESEALLSTSADGKA